MRYILYARKSSESADRQVQSLPDQLRVLKELANRLGLVVCKTLEEARSAKEPGNRPLYSQMISTIRQGKADAILCWSVNRLTRNPIDAGELGWLLQKGILKSIRTIDREYCPEDSALLMSFETGVATQYVIDLRKNVIRGLHEKANRGWWPTKPPPGYRTNPFTHEVEPNPDTFPILRKAWDLLLTGSYTVPQILDKLNEWGYADRPESGKRSRPMARTCLYRLFSNTFYYGPFYYGGEIHEGRHMPMISVMEFERAQEIVSGGPKTKQKRHEFAFTGLIRCGVCGCQITAERKVKAYPTTGNHSEYVYYRCTGAKGCKKDSVPEAYLEKEIEQLVRRCQTNVGIESWIEGVLRRDFDERPATDRTIEGQQDATRRSTKARLNALFEMREGGEITAEEFVIRKGTLQATLAEIDSSERKAKDRWERNLEALRRASRFSKNAYERFTTGGPLAKKQIAKLLADAYFLTLGNLEIQPNPVFDILRTFEPPKEPSDMVQGGALATTNPVQRAERDRLRTLLTEVDLRFDDETFSGRLTQ